MKEAGLAVAERLGPALEFRANRAHPHAGTLLSLLALPARAAPLVAPTKGDRGPSRVIWRQRDSLDYRRLTREAIRRNEGPALGFYLQLTGRLGRDLRLVRRAWPLRDGRRTAARPFFSDQATCERPLPLARRWGYLVSIELARFAAAFRA
jgi:hypothetical protein